MEQGSRSDESSIEEALRECIEDVIDAFNYEPSRGSVPELTDALTDAVQSRFLKGIGYTHAQMVSRYHKCQDCSLHKTRLTVCFGDGDPNEPDVLVIGEAPGPDEDKVGIPFVGRTGKFLRECLSKVGFQNPYFTNAVACFPKSSIPGSGFRAPRQEEIQACSNRLNWIIENIAPRSGAVLLVGIPAFIAVTSLIADSPISTITDRLRRVKMKDNLGWIDNDITNCTIPIYTTYHPSYILRTGPDEKITQSWVDDLKAVFKYVKTNVKTHPRHI